LGIPWAALIEGEAARIGSRGGTLGTANAGGLHFHFHFHFVQDGGEKQRQKQK
jgi:hypothetical protein